MWSFLDSVFQDHKYPYKKPLRQCSRSGEIQPHLQGVVESTQYYGYGPTPSTESNSSPVHSRSSVSALSGLYFAQSTFFRTLDIRCWLWWRYVVRDIHNIFTTYSQHIEIGILSESLSRLGGNITALDPSVENIAVATEHARQDRGVRPLDIDYRCQTIEDFSRESDSRDSFDIVCSLEVIEHVEAPEVFLQHLTEQVKVSFTTFVRWTIECFIFCVLNSLVDCFSYRHLIERYCRISWASWPWNGFFNIYPRIHIRGINSSSLRKSFRS